MRKLPAVALSMLCLGLLPNCVNPTLIKQVPDTMMCIDEQKDIYCHTFVSKKTIVIDKDHPYQSKLTGDHYSVEQVRAISLMMPPDHFVALKNFFDNLCHEINCDGVGDWQSFANDLAGHIKTKVK